MQGCRTRLTAGRRRRYDTVAVRSGVGRSAHTHAARRRPSGRRAHRGQLMWYPESMHRDAMRHGFGRSVVGRWSAFLLLCIALMVPGLSRAACTTFTPTNASAGSPMPAGGTITIDASSCQAVAGFGIGDVQVPASHGTATTTSHAASQITYVNSGDGATTDTFTYDDGDGDGNNVTVTVYIAAATSPITLSPSSMPSGTV